MRWIVIVIVIIAYYFLLGIGLNFLLQDPFITSAEGVGNKSFSFDATDVNMTVLNLEDQTTLRSFPNALQIMFGFRTPLPTAIPQTVTSILSFLNWFLLIIFGIAVYRLVNPIAA